MKTGKVYLLTHFFNSSQNSVKNQCVYDGNLGDLKHYVVNEYTEDIEEIIKNIEIDTHSFIFIPSSLSSLTVTYLN
jgi:hypothetical protein